jgi:sugar transferase (PEP-CTERM/EpsH1 system associated)
MKILYLAHRIPYPPDKGEKIRAYHQIRYLCGRHELHLACLVDDESDMRHVPRLEEHCASVDVAYRSKTAANLRAGLALFTGKPLSAASFFSRELQRKILDRIRMVACDVIIVYSSSMAGYVLHVLDIPKVMDFVDVDSEKWRQYAELRRPPMSWIYRTEALRLAHWEEQIARTFDHSIVITERESRLLRGRESDRRISVISNGVDLEFYSPDGQGEIAAKEPVVVFTGVMDYFPNVDAVDHFCHEIFPHVRRAVPDAAFHIVGRNPTKQVIELARLPNVVVTGGVPDVRPYLSRASVSVAPLRVARGLQNKVLEAMAMGLPVVTTPEILDSIEATEANGVRAADDPEQFASAIIALLQDPALREATSVRARQYVERRHRWESMGAQLEQVATDVARATGRKS